MKFLKFLLAAFIAGVFSTAALSQSAPSPIFKNVTIQGTLNGKAVATGPATSTIGNVVKFGSTDGQTFTDGGALGTAATQNTGASGHNLPFLDGTNTWSAAQSFSSLTASTAIPVASGGTGAATAAAARANLSAAALGANSDITSLSGLTTALSVAQGGTGSGVAATALSNLGGQPLNAGLTSLSGIGTGIVANTAANTFTPRTLTGTANQITVTNGTGVSGNPTISFPSAMTMTGITLTGGTYNSVAIGSGSTYNGLAMTGAATMASSSGSFTPVLNFGGATTGITYSTQQGNYVRLGNLVLIQIRISLSSKGSATGVATITGLPFSIPTTAPNDNQIIPIAGAGNMTSLTSALFGAIPTSAPSTINLSTFNSTGSAQISDTSFSSTSILVLSGVINIGALN